MKKEQNGISIRRARLEDFELIYDLICQLENCTFHKKTLSEVYSDNINNRNIHYYVALEDEKVIGFVSWHVSLLLHHSEKVVEIQELIVDKNLRSTGIGRILINKVEELVKKDEISLLEVSCNRKRVKALSFYEKLGFTKSHYKFTKKI